jgi:disulfide bond formation protein DsbB
MNDKSWPLLFFCWFVAISASVGSLFFSEVLKLVPCDLCWYQRICLFPLVIILLRALFPLNLSVVKFALPLAWTGGLIAFYHNLLYYHVIPEKLSPCTSSLSCIKIDFVLWGHISIPQLSLLTFMIIIGLLLKLSKGLYETEL